MTEEKLPAEDALLQVKRSRFTTHQYYNQLTVAAAYVKEKVGVADIAIVLGSGLNLFYKQLSDVKSVDYDHIPFMPRPRVAGHFGTLYVGTLPSKKSGTVRVMCFAGRVHAYEGWRPHEMNFITRMCCVAGVKLVILTNAAGGSDAVNTETGKLESMDAGSIMIIRDHIRFTNSNPMVDVCRDPRFGPVCLSTQGLYSARVAAIAKEAAKIQKLRLYEGVYGWFTGPTYETPWEVQAGVRFGCGAFGMSTVPEAMAGAAMGAEVFAMSLVTNKAAGLQLNQVLTHDDVKDVANESGPRFERLMKEIINQLTLPGAQDVRNRPSPHQLPAMSVPVHTNDNLAWSPTLHHVFTDAMRLQEANTYQPAPSIAWFLAPGQVFDFSATVLKLSDVRALTLADLPYFRAYATTQSARNGRVFLSTLTHGGEKKRLVIVDHLGAEGFSDVESMFLMQILSAVGVRSLLASYLLQLATAAPEAAGAQPPAYTAAPTDILDEKDADAKDVCEVRKAHKPTQYLINLDMFFCTDLLDRTQNNVPAPVHPLLGERSVNTHVLDRDLLDVGVSYLEHRDNMCQAVGCVHQGTMVGFAGPSFPTPTEVNTLNTIFSRSTNCDEYGFTITSIAPLEAAKALGMKVLALALALPQASFENPDVCADRAALSRSVVEHLFCEISGSNKTPAAKPVLDQVAKLLDRAPALTVSHSSQASQENYDHVSAARDALIQQVKAAAPELPELASVGVAVVAEQPFAPVFAQMQIKFRIRCNKLPHFFTVPDRWELVVGHLNGKPLVLAADLTSKDAEYDRVGMFTGLNPVIRLLALLYPHLILLTPLCSAHKCNKVGDLVVLRDHINMSGRNPLYGMNDERWGARFPDMSGLYCETVRKALLNEKLPDGGAIKEVIVAHVGGALLHSHAEGLLARAVGASALASGVAPQTILAKHMKRTTTAIGLFTQSVATYDTYAAPLQATEAHVRAAAQLLAKAIEAFPQK